ncbi:MAG: hypothetical protein ACO3PR_00110 [Limisphaerales bacterium]
MSDELEHQEMETTEEISSVVEESAAFLNQDENEEPGFLDSMNERLDEAGISGGDEFYGDTEDTSYEETEETEEVTSDETEDEEDLASDFPTAEDLKDTLDDEKAVAKWGELRAELDAERTKTRELEEKLDATKSQTVAEELERQLAESREQVNAYEQELSIARVERSPEYQRVVAEPLQNIMDAAEEIAMRNEKDVEQIFDALSSGTNPARQQRELEAITEGMSEPDKFAIYSMVRDASAIFAKDHQLKQQAAEAVVELEAAERQKAEEAAAQQAVKIRDGVRKVFSKLKEVTPDLGEGVELSSLEESTLKEDFTSLDSDHQAYALSSAAMVPPLIKALNARDAKIAQLEKDISGYTKSKPKVGGSGVQTPTPESDPSDLGFIEGMEKRLTEAGV